jgi:hypothetical protein
LIPFRTRQHLYFVQNDFDQVKQLNNELLSPFKSNIRYSQLSDETKRRVADVDLTASNTSMFHIRFGSTYIDEYRRLVDLNLAHMQTIVWQRERTHLMANARLYQLYTWSSNEIDELISTGYLNNYSIVYRYDPFVYPDLVDDPTNFMFKPKTKKSN